jgi:hypothetical protein
MIQIKMTDQGQLNLVSYGRGAEMGPDESQMFEVFQDLLDQWTGLPCSNIGAPVEWPTNLPVERMVVFSGPVEGCLVLRGPERLLAVFLDQLMTLPEQSTEDFSGDAIGEFTRRYLSGLAEIFWEGQDDSTQVYLSRFSDPSTWPTAKPNRAFTVLVRNLSVEIRLWTWGTPHKSHKA